MMSRAVMVLALSLVLTPWTYAQEARPDAAASLKRLKEGNERFAADQPSARTVNGQRRTELTKGQHPFAIIVTCADSRVGPELLFDVGLGDIFVLRVAGNIADPAVVGSVEYAVEHLHAPLIVVLGHENCGAVRAAIDGTPLTGDLGWLIKQVKPGDKLPEEQGAKIEAGVRNNVLAAAADLKGRSKIISEEVAHHKVEIVTGVYSLKTGKIEWIAAGAAPAPSPSVALPPLAPTPVQPEPLPSSSPSPSPQSSHPTPAPVIVAVPEPQAESSSPSPSQPFPRLRGFFKKLRDQ